MSAPRMTPREWGLLILLSFIWGGAFFLAAFSLREVNFYALTFLRVFIAALTLGLLALFLRASFPKGAGEWSRLALLSLFSTAMPFTLLYWAQTHIASGLAAILNAMTPIFTILIAHIFTQDERMDARRFMGVLAGIAGVAVIVGPSAIGHVGSNAWAEAAVLGAGCCYAIAGVYGRRFKGQSPVTLSFAQMVFASAVLLPVMLMSGPVLHVEAPSLTVIAAVIALGALSTGLAFVMFFRILASAGATNAALVTLLVPVSAILLGVMILGESITWRQFAGLALIVFGLIINDGRLLQFLRERLTRLDGGAVVSGSRGARMINEPHRLQ